MAVAGAFTVALDVPSGLDADTGATAPPAVHADLTTTFGAPKVGLLAEAAQALVGELVVIDMSLPRALTLHLRTRP